MSIKESALTAITSIAQGDFVRAVTSAGASRRVTVSNLAKAIIESYSGSSLAGSSRSVQSALTYEAQDYVIDGVTFVFKRVGRFVTVVSGGTPTTPIPTDGYAGSVTVASQWRPSNAVVLIVTANNTANMQVNLATDGTFRVGFASTAISNPVRCNFTYVSNA